MKKLLLALVLATATAWGQAVQLSSGVTQRPTTDAPSVVQMEQVDLASGVLLPDASTVQIVRPGLYFVVAAPQVGRLNGGNAATFRCWLRVNGVDVPNSNVLLALKNGTKDVIVSQGILALREGDKLQVMQATDAPNNVGCEAIDIAGEPLVPAIIFSAYRLAQ